MDDPSTNPYEKRLYSVFKSFDVNNEESLDAAAVTRLCDALQLEERGAALVGALFERGPDRVTFAEFRAALLAALADRATASDDDSSGREVEPKFVFGSKKYGRRSRPAAEGDSAADAPPLDHLRLVDRDEALALCRALRMRSIDRGLVQRIFDTSPTPETTVGDFFDRLNRSLASATGARSPADDGPRADDAADDDDDDAGVAVERVAEAWERGGVRRPRRLLAELGFGGPRLRPPDLERALDDELRAFDERPDERATLLAAALATARLRAAAARVRRDAAAAERDKLRADVAEANRRAAALAQEVDDNHARIEADLKAGLERASARHADDLRRALDDAAQERERAAADRAALQEEISRRADAEARLRAEAAALRRRAEEAEAAAAAADDARGASERAAARAEARAADADARAAAAAAAAEAAAALEGRAATLARDNERLRTRVDDLSAALEAAASARPSPNRPDLSPLTSQEQGVEGEPAAPPAPPADDADKVKLVELVKELEGGLEAMRAEYEACEEYWGSKLAEERAAHEADARASADRLADLVARIADFERRLAPAPALPPIPEARALEAQVADLEAEFARYRRDASARLAAARRRRGARRDCARCQEAAARADAAARRLLARLAAADALVKDLYVENCRLAHRAPPL